MRYLNGANRKSQKVDGQNVVRWQKYSINYRRQLDGYRQWQVYRIAHQENPFKISLAIISL
jgi:hypothetical protein